MPHAALPLLLFAPALLAAVTSPGAGISEALANERAASIGSLRYQLSFRIPESRSEAVRGEAIVRFVLRAAHTVTLDFEQKRDHITSVEAAGKPVPFNLIDGHIVIPASATRGGENALRIAFIAGDESLNRNDEFLYTLFVPARAHYAFPCFDQPNLKARYALTLHVPAAWQAVANGAEVSRDIANSRAVVQFAETRALSTYLFAFAAGRFQVETAERYGRGLRMFHRETDAAKVARNRDAIFDLHALALKWLEDYTGIAYPWGKFDFVLIPSFQFGGMEHAGAILYNSSGLMLDPSATQSQLLERASVIAHETAHMWFGDLVTMRWFNDVWMKEVLANFFAAKIVNPGFPEINHELRFLLTHYPAAFEVDRTAGTNPIRQQLANLNEAGSLYGPIIYNKAPIVMRQLETIMGVEGFRQGMQDYLRRFSFRNATWLDLVNILEARRPGRVAKWSEAWVEKRGRPEIVTELRTDRRGTVESLVFHQRDALGGHVVWPQQLQVAVGYSDGIRSLPVSLDGAGAAVPQARGLPAPLYILPNGGGLGYGLFRLDERTLAYLLARLEDIPDALTRGSAWVDVWENLLEGAVKPGDFIELALRALPRETDEQNTQRILSYLSRAFWHELPVQERTYRAARIESVLLRGLDEASTASLKSAWFKAFRDMCLTREGVAKLERVWRREEMVPGLTFAETDEIDMAMNLAVREVRDWKQILIAQRDRTENPDRKARLQFVIPALSADPAEREAAFARFREPRNRSHEAWVLEAERYLNHPLREAHAIHFVQPALDLLQEIQQTGDIFFPKRWMDATLAGHRSREAADIVKRFLASHPELPERLRWVVLDAADDLFRTASRN